MIFVRAKSSLRTYHIPTSTNTITKIESQTPKQWLPAFLKQVAEFLGSEKTRCREVFGAEEAPLVLGRLLVETFTCVFSLLLRCL